MGWFTRSRSASQAKERLQLVLIHDRTDMTPAELTSLRDEILQVMREMREHGIDMLTIGQYLAPSGHHLPVRRYAHPDVFRMFEAEAARMGFSHAACGPMVRSSYHADQQAHAAGVA